MHECPECGQACDCDGEDLWNDWDSEDVLNCTHACDPSDLNDDDRDDDPADSIKDVKIPDAAYDQWLDQPGLIELYIQGRDDFDDTDEDEDTGTGYQISADGTAITCLRCGMTSHNPNDIKNLYCGYCKTFHTAATDENEDTGQEVYGPRGPLPNDDGGDKGPWG